MKDSIKLKINFLSIINALIIAYIFSTIALDSYSKYVPIRNVITLALIGVLGIFAINRRTLEFGTYAKTTIAFVLFCFCSTLWAAAPASTLTRGITMLQIFLVNYLIYEYLYFTNQEKKILSMIAIAGTLASLFVIIYYGGFNYFRLINTYYRMGQDIANTNDLGIFAAVACAISFYKFYSEKKRIYIVLFIICLVITGGSGSRSALIMALLPILAYSLSLIEPKKAIKVLASIIAFVLILYFISTRISVFDYTISRLLNVQSFFSGEGYVDRSVLSRQNMVEEGLEQFIKTPILGIGIANASIFLSSHYYCHNNYVELLSTGGLVGFLVFYLRYIFPLGKLMPIVKKKNPTINFIVALILSFMVIEYFHVSYYEKFSSFIPMIGFLCVSMVKKEKVIRDGEK